MDYRQTRVEALASIEASIERWERLDAINREWVAKGDHRPLLVKRVTESLAASRETKAAILSISDEEWETRRQEYKEREAARLVRFERAHDALWEGKISHEQYFEEIGKE